ncbi:MAG: methyltransferase family protein [Candidatus Hodarchaeota archaeon]
MAILIIILTIFFEILFLVNLILYWFIILKVKSSTAKIHYYCKKIFPIVWTCCLVFIILLSSNIIQFVFKENFSYFQDLWSWFIILGTVFIIAGLKIASMAKKLFKVKAVRVNGLKLIKKGIYSVIRHPIYLSWLLIFMGFCFVFDSYITLIFLPVFSILLEIHSILEERYILIPAFGKKYHEYKNKTPFRLLPQPYNYIFMILAVIVVYIGFFNFLLKG